MGYWYRFGQLTPRERQICETWAEECKTEGSWGAQKRAGERLGISTQRVSQVVRRWRDAPEVEENNSYPRHAPRHVGSGAAVDDGPSVRRAYIRNLREIGHGALTETARQFKTSTTTVYKHTRGLWRPQPRRMPPGMWAEGWECPFEVLRPREWWRVDLPYGGGFARVCYGLGPMKIPNKKYGLRIYHPDGTLEGAESMADAKHRLIIRYLEEPRPSPICSSPNTSTTPESTALAAPDVTEFI